MSAFPWKKTVLWTAAVVAMVGLGWAVAKIAGPPSPIANQVAPAAPPAGGVANVPAEPRNTALACLQAWVGKNPSDKVNGRALFEIPAFTAALRKTLGTERYDELSSAPDWRQQYFEDVVKNEGGLIRIDIGSLSTGAEFNASVIVNPETSAVDACWVSADEYRTETGLGDPTDVLLHTGQKYRMGSQLCMELPAQGIANPVAYLTRQAAVKKSLIGTWTGSFSENHARGVVCSLSRQLTFRDNPSAPDELFFEMKEQGVANNGIFTCTRSNRFEESVQGNATIKGDTIDLSCNTRGKPDCIKDPNLRLQLQGDRLMQKDDSVSPMKLDQPLAKTN